MFSLSVATQAPKAAQRNWPTKQMCEKLLSCEFFGLTKSLEKHKQQRNGTHRLAIETWTEKIRWKRRNHFFVLLESIAWPSITVELLVFVITSFCCMKSVWATEGMRWSHLIVFIKQNRIDLGRLFESKCFGACDGIVLCDFCGFKFSHDGERLDLSVTNSGMITISIRISNVRLITLQIEIAIFFQFTRRQRHNEPEETCDLGQQFLCTWASWALRN